MVSTTGVVAEAYLRFEGVIYREGVVQRAKQRVKMWVKPIASLCVYRILPGEGAKAHVIGPTKASRGWFRMAPQADPELVEPHLSHGGSGKLLSKLKHLALLPVGLLKPPAAELANLPPVAPLSKVGGEGDVAGTEPHPC